MFSAHIKSFKPFSFQWVPCNPSDKKRKAPEESSEKEEPAPTAATYKKLKSDESCTLESMDSSVQRNKILVKELALLFQMEDLDYIAHDIMAEDGSLFVKCLSAIAEHLPKEELPRFPNKIYSYIKCGAPPNTLLAELGLALFAYETQKEEIYEKWITNEIHSLLRYYDAAFVKKIVATKKDAIERIQWNSNSRIPIGTTHSTLDFITDLIITKEGKVNTGSIIAADLLISRRLLGAQLNAEHTQLIHATLLEMLSSPSFTHKIEKAAIPSNDFANEILATLKLPQTTILTKPLFQKALLIALFSQIFQYSYQGNCYTIGTLNAVRLLYPEKVFDLLLSLFFEKNIEASDETFPVPLTKIWEDQFVDRSEFESTVSGNAFYLPSFVNILTAAGLSINDITSGFVPWREYPLKHFFDLIESKTSHHTRVFAEQTYLSYKDPILLRLFCCKVEFYLANGQFCVDDLLSYKQYFLNAMNAGIKESLTKICPYKNNDPAHIDKINRLRSSVFYYASAFLNRYFWVEDYSQQKPEPSDNSVVLKRKNYSKTFQGQNDLMETISSFLKQIKPFFIYENDEKKDLHSFSHFEPIFRTVIKDTFLMHSLGGEDEEKEERVIKAMALTARDSVIGFNHMCTRFRAISKEAFKQLDLCFMGHKGFATDVILPQFFGLSFSRTEVEVSGVKSFFFSYPWSDTPHEKYTVDDLPEAVVTRTFNPKHCFVTFPRLFEEFLHEDAGALIDALILDPAKAILDDPFPLEPVYVIVKDLGLDHCRIDCIINAQKSARDFKNFVLAELREDQKMQFMGMFNRYCHQTSILPLTRRANIQAFLDLLEDKCPEVKFSDEIADKIIEQIAKRFSESSKAVCKLSIENIAHTISVIIQSNIKRPYSLYTIEKSVAEFLKHPMTIELGNNNYDRANREIQAKEKLVARFDFSEENLVFAIRSLTYFKRYFPEHPSPDRRVAFVYYYI